MSRSINKVIVLILLMSQVLNILGKLTILSGRTLDRKKKVICSSENDGGALVWNANLKLTSSYKNRYIIDPNAKHFSSTCTSYNSQIDCKLNNESGCLNSWKREYWKLTNSIIMPMGPVFDQRWEEFEEYTYTAKSTHNIKLSNTNTIVLPFSVRARKDVYVLICNQEYQRNLCYWVIIGGWENTKSAIRKCSKGVPNIGVYPKDRECAIQRDYLKHTALDEYEWRTFVLTWNSETKTISLYDSDQLIVTYRDMDVYNNINFIYKLFIRSDLSMMIRFHKYDYLYTSTKNAILTSDIFYINTKDLCLQMLIGLCAQCDADISLRTSSNEVLQTVTVKGSSVAVVHGLPMWQPVKITANITTHSYDEFKVVVTPKLNLNNSNPVWAIANIRRCPRDGCLRQSGMFIFQDWNASSKQYFWPNVICQNCFYKEQSVVQLFNDADLNVELDDKNCPVGYIGPSCYFHCNSDLNSTHCMSVVICNNNGCTCTSGYRGAKCNIPCDNNFYGHACKNSCGSCLYEAQCDPASGMCHLGCENMKNYFYIPPLCQIGIDEPSEIEFIFTNQTTIVATVPIKWKKEYERIELLYKFDIQRPDGKFVKQQEWKIISQNSTKLAEIFENLDPGTTYSILPMFSINQFSIYGEFKDVDTHCDSIKNFNITPDETSLMIVGETENQLYPCPINSYNLLFINNENQERKIIHGSILHFPYTLPNLNPYTSYNVTILYRKEKLFSEEIRTLEGIPSKVLSLTALSLSSTNVSLFWVSPERTNGIIKEYVVQLTVAEYFGCKNVTPPTPSKYILVERTNKMEITLSGLHAYAKYNVQVIAQNSRHSSIPAKMEFSLPEAAIPVVTFSQIKMENWILSWKPPEDCTAILGPLVSSVEILGISDAVKNFNVTKNTKHNQIDLENILHGAEHYVAKIFASRGYDKPINTSAYKEHEFETPSKAPPNVTSLEVVEIENYETIHLRWHSPLPPLNGILRGYEIIVCHYEIHRMTPCNVIQVEFNETCNLWNDYICKSIRYTNNNIQVVAYNKGVPGSSPPVNVTTEMLHNTMPDPPHNLTFTIHNNSIVDFKWLHPWRTGGHVRCFHIIIEEISSTLRSRTTQSFNKETHDFPVTHYLRSYSLQLYLLPSTQYNISIQTETTTNKTGNTNFLEIGTPSSIDIDGELEVSTQESVILLHIPKVLNDTLDSVTYIGIKESDICKQRAKLPEDLLIQAGEDRIEYVSQIAKNSTSQLTGQVYSFDNDQSTNCSLKNGELYEIVVIITECDSSGERFILKRKKSFYFGEYSWVYRSEVWLTCIILIIAAACAIYYFYKK